MRALSALVIGFVALLVSVSSFGLTHVEATYGYYLTNPPLDHTIQTVRIIEQSDINYWAVDGVFADNYYKRNGTPVSVLDSHVQWVPAVATTQTVRLTFMGYSSPLPAEYVGNYLLESWMALRGMWCDSTAEPIYCDYYYVCNQNLTEPCFDDAYGYIN